MDVTLAAALSELAGEATLSQFPHSPRHIRAMSVESQPHTSVQNYPPPAGLVRAGDGNRTRVLSLGISPTANQQTLTNKNGRSPSPRIPANDHGRTRTRHERAMGLVLRARRSLTQRLRGLQSSDPTWLKPRGTCGGWILKRCRTRRGHICSV